MNRARGALPISLLFGFDAVAEPVTLPHTEVRRLSSEINGVG